MDNSAITHDEIIETYDEEKKKQFQQILMKRKQSVKCKIYIFFMHYIIALYCTIALLIPVIIYWYLIKYEALALII